MYVADAKRLTLAGARKMMATAMGLAEQEQVPIAVAIADAGGHLMALERMDGGRFHTVHSSTTKAVCAASNKRPTAAKGAQAQPLDTTHAIGLALAAGPERWRHRGVWRHLGIRRPRGPGGGRRDRRRLPRGRQVDSAHAQPICS